MYFVYQNYNEVHQKIQKLYVLQHEYYVRKVSFAESPVSEIEEAIAEPVTASFDTVESPTCSEYKEITEVIPNRSRSTCSNDDFQFVSAEEEKILARTKADLARYRKNRSSSSKKARTKKESYKETCKRKQLQFGKLLLQ